MRIILFVFLLIGLFSQANGQRFIEVDHDFGLKSVSVADHQYADIDGDLDLDLAISGSACQGRNFNIYLNDGDGNFQIKSDIQIPDFFRGAMKFAKLDDNNSMDLIIASGSSTRIFLNDGQGNFIENNQNEI